MSKVQIEKGRLKNIWEKCKALSSQRLWRIFSVLLIVSVVFDLLPIQYANDFLEQVFTYNLGNVIAIIVVIWTFTVSLSTYCMDKLEKYYYGIRMFDVLRNDKSILALIGLVLTELFFLILSAIGEWEITITIIAIQQFLAMIHIFYVVFTKISFLNIFHQTYLQIEEIFERDLKKLTELTESKNQEYSNWEADEKRIKRLNQAMLFKMTRGLDYTDNSARENLLELIAHASEILSRELKNCQDKQRESNLLEVKHYINIVSYQITSDILNFGEKREIIIDFLYCWITIENIVLEIKQGIIMALLENITPQNVSIYQSLIRAEMNHQRELKIWSAVYNVYLQEYSEGEKWRFIYIERQFKELYSDWKQEDAKVAMDYWKQIHGFVESYRPLFQYIFWYERLEVL